MIYVRVSGIPPGEKRNRVLNDIHMIFISSNSTLLFDVHLISLETSRVAHPVSNILGETLVYVKVC